MKLFQLTLILGALLLSFSARAQQDRQAASYDALRQEADRQISDYLKLVKMGYSEQEIFEDLGNVNFLTGNFRTASFWYQKLVDLIGEDAISLSYQERYKVALHKAGIRQFPELEQNKDWFTRVREDYQIDKSPVGDHLTQSLAENYRRPDFASDPGSPSEEALERLQRYAIPEISAEDGFQPGLQHAYTPPVALAANGKTAFFSKAEWVRPVTGLFSRKQLIHKLYRADYVAGQWKNIQEVPVAPKYASALHPAVSRDGRRLFFASDMPGSYGEYDIYVAEVSWDGSLGPAKNLGEKVNTRKNDLYPQVLGDDLLFFASEGHEGFGGLDVFAAQVGTKRVGLAVNVGSPFNSGKDDFALHLMKEKGRAYVMSNRAAAKDVVQQLVFAYQNPESSHLAESGNYRFLELRSLDANTGYTHTVFEE